LKKKEGEDMNKAELIDAIAKKTQLKKKDAELFLAEFMKTVKETVKKGQSVQLMSFGTFSQAQRAARKGRNPRTGAEIKIPATKYPKFTPGSDFKTMVKGK